MKRLFAVLALLGALGLAVAPVLGAQDKPSAEPAAAVPASPAAPAAAPAAAAPQAAAPAPNKGDVAWMLVSTALVIMMSVPALALFYGGMVRAKNMLSVLMQVFVTFSLVTVLWAIYGYSLAFTEGNAFFGGFDRLFLGGTFDAAKGEFAMAGTFSKATPIPELVFVAFQATFAAITCCLVLGAFAERIKFSAVLIFMVLWFTFAYVPIAHMVWFWPGPDAYTDAKLVDSLNAKAGLIWQWGALDFAGGTVVHINAGVAAVIAALLLGPRKDYARQAILPHSVPFTLLGAGLLWFGWFGFNAGSALGATPIAALAFVNTMLAPAATLIVWTMLDLSRTGRATAVGAATAIVVGLVAVTPAAGFVSPLSAIVLGALAAFPSYYAVLWRARTRLDDSLDVLAAHGVGGTVGAILTGVLAQKAWNGVADGLIAGNPVQVAVQALAVLAAAAYSAGGTLVLLRLVGAFLPLRVVDPAEEGLGLDVSQHGEEAYSTGEGAILVLTEPAPLRPEPTPEPAGGPA